MQPRFDGVQARWPEPAKPWEIVEDGTAPNLATAHGGSAFELETQGSAEDFHRKKLATQEQTLAKGGSNFAPEAVPKAL